MKTYSLLLSDEASEEALEAYFWYEEQRAGLGESFRENLDHKMIFLKQNPLSSSFIFENIRSSKIERFPFNIIYRIVGSQIQVIAIFHHSRNPNEWRKRI